MRAWSQRALVVVAWLLVVCTVGQIFLAGLAVFVGPQWWLRHREFVDGFAWAHLDIAGTAYTDREDATRVKGPTGIGVRLFSEFVLARQDARPR